VLNGFRSYEDLWIYIKYIYMEKVKIHIDMDIPFYCCLNLGSLLL
jgi:hypothetical protein